MYAEEIPMKIRNPASFSILLAGLLLLLSATGLLFTNTVSAQTGTTPGNTLAPLHPIFPLLDSEGKNVLETGNPVSTMQTCGACHNAEFIASHSFHTTLGLEDFGNPTSGRPWDTSPGLFGKWNPLTYRYLSPEGDTRPDLTLPEWLMTFGARVVGGGPAEETDLFVDDSWNWEKSGTVEMNCFLCHTENPNNTARVSALQAGDFQWANTATLLNTGVIVPASDGVYTYNPEAFTPEGDLSTKKFSVQDPTNDNCAQCHSLAHTDLTTPLTLTSCDLENWTTATTGQIISPQKLANTGLNLTNKDTLTRSLDVHAERLVQCTDCHFSLNNPVYYQSSSEDVPEHLTFDPRRLEIGEYLQQPDHQFARGQSAQGTVASELKGTMRRCESCHDAANTHDWLPYAETHFEAVACESCHIPEMYAPAIQTSDWTVLTLAGEPNTTCRGVEGEPGTVTSLITGFQPVLLPRQNIDGQTQLAPYNLITAWYWVYGEEENTRPVRLEDLQAAWLKDGAYAPEILAVFDENQDGFISSTELVIDNAQKEAAVRERLTALGLETPQIAGEIQPYSINHTVTTDEWAIKDCQTCHGANSRITQAMILAPKLPGDVQPQFVRDANTLTNGELSTAPDGTLVYTPVTAENDLYVLGHDSVTWIDWAGIIFFIGTVAGVSVHGGLRYQAARKNSHHAHVEIKQVYMYAVYERFWHWMQTVTILLLILTGLIIHKPEMFGFLAFPHAVLVHNILAAILVINAALSLFYHLVSGEIQQYIPRPYGFFDQAIQQSLFYLKGIFKGEAHPFEKTPQKKLNPLQQMVYFGILNVLLPLQVITGALMWGVQRWSEVAGRLGGLPFLVPFHSLIAWLFASFIVMHVYLTTTGHTPTAAIKAMMLGWDEVEVHPIHTEAEASAD
jgi:thiosulfate reductase cytochrome b subunit